MTVKATEPLRLTLGTTECDCCDRKATAAENKNAQSVRIRIDDSKTAYVAEAFLPTTWSYTFYRGMEGLPVQFRFYCPSCVVFIKSQGG